MSKMIPAMRAAFAALALTFAAPAFADGPGDAGADVAAPPVRATPAPQAQPSAAPAPPPAALQSGQITLRNGVTLNVPQGYAFYGPNEARAFLRRNAATEPQGEVIGLVAAADARIDQPGTWGTVLSYDPVGYVQADTAAGLTAPNFEGDVRTARASQNRTFEGFAAEPAFDAAGLSVSWAERTAGPATQGPDARHEQRVLGRRGVVGLTGIGSADQLPAMQAAAQALTSALAFGPGERHADYDAATDEASAYGVPNLVTGVPNAQQPALAETASAGAPTTGEQTGGGGLQGLFPWIAGGAVVLAGAGYMLWRRGRRGEDDDNLTPDEA